MERRLLLPMAAGLLLTGKAVSASSAWVPTRPIRLIVPFGAGGSTDVTARLIAEALGARLGQPVVVENRAGAGGNIGSEAVARAEPDGYTLLLTTSTTHATNPALYGSLPFDVQRDFAPITLTAFIPNVLVVPSSKGIRHVRELIELGRRKPGELNYGSAGAGSSQHLASALFAARAEMRMTHVPYRGGALAVTDLLGGKLDLLFSPLVEVLEHVRAGRMTALAITTKERSPLLPDVPPLGEILPGYEVRLWNGLLAPAATPKPVIERIAHETNEVLRTPQMREKLAQQGSTPAGGTPEEFAGFIRAELPKWAELVRISGARIE
ncbi:Bug family tripartite tricarboxylate transporter substrate binding protein [Roseomonas xinghualingensis]|uniref:Bug family tripartite tricarboxylate transporter substrate binding protein n=1 Tax=Roseomonas xinghualingensis TaxID=2986475 RepID=UPI0021F241A1|nr:tripartite tricarboxylate transporter substrate binding protein [Roseomonas sp. SXEYE001]MCV4206231.1 tripartite tricarboxylate transporter substrate binding protein [Roseomonas sp. SXEYE001]